jgi:hypothetical protein
MGEEGEMNKPHGIIVFGANGSGKKAQTNGTFKNRIFLEELR